MANLAESNVWESGVYRIETTDLVLGGDGGIANIQGGQLANRTVYLKAITDALGSASTKAASTTATPNYVPQADGAGKIAKEWLPDATTSAKGAVELATDGEVAANVAVQGNDARLAQATETNRGTVELATSAEIIVGTDTDRVPSVANLKTALASDGMWLTKRTKMPDGATAVYSQDAWATTDGWGAVNGSNAVSLGTLVFTPSGSSGGPRKQVSGSSNKIGMALIKGTGDFVGATLSIYDYSVTRVISTAMLSASYQMILFLVPSDLTGVYLRANGSTGTIIVDWLWIGDYSYAAGSLSEEAARIANQVGDTPGTGTLATGWFRILESGVLDGDTVTVGGKTYTFTSGTPSVEGQVKIDASYINTRAYLLWAIDRNDPGTYDGVVYKIAARNPLVRSTPPYDYPNLTTDVPGELGNQITLSTNAPTRIFLSGPTLTGGTSDAAERMASLVMGTSKFLSGGSYGVSWNQSTDTYTRLGTTAGQALAAKPAEGLLSVHSRMRRCVLRDDLSVAYYLDPNNSALKADGSASVLDGTDGQVMVEIPKFYYRYSYASNVHSWEVAPSLLPGFEVHPMFLVDGVEKDYKYVGAYEAILWDTSASAYTDGGAAQVKDWTATTGDKLSSVSGKLAVTNATRAQFRQGAKNRGAGWTQQGYADWSGLQLLFLTEYASFKSQAVLGAGITNVVSADWTAYNGQYALAPTGNSNGIGNASGNTAGSAVLATEISKYVSYRGIEQFYGHIWKAVDGVNILADRQWYQSLKPASWADDTATGYEKIADAGATDGYIATIANTKYGFVPASVPGSSTTKIPDYYYQAAGNRVLFVGGYAYFGAYAGVFSVLAVYASSLAFAAFGGRLCASK